MTRGDKVALSIVGSMLLLLLLCVGLARSLPTSVSTFGLPPEGTIVLSVTLLISPVHAQWALRPECTSDNDMLTVTAVDGTSTVWEQQQHLRPGIARSDGSCTVTSEFWVPEAPSYVFQVSGEDVTGQPYDVRIAVVSRALLKQTTGSRPPKSSVTLVWRGPG